MPTEGDAQASDSSDTATTDVATADSQEITVTEPSTAELAETDSPEADTDLLPLNRDATAERALSATQVPGQTQLQNGHTDIAYPDDDLRAMANSYSDACYTHFPPEELPALKQAAYKKFSARVRNPDTILSRDNDRLTGMVGFDYLGTNPEGKPVVEISNVVVNPDYKRRGLFPTLFKQIIKNISARYQNAIVSVVTGTLNPEMLKRTGFEEMDLRDFFKSVNDPRLADADEMKSIHKMSAFVLDLGKATSGT